MTRETTAQLARARVNDQRSSEIQDMMFRFAIDRGGTFTDVYAECPKGRTRVMKLLSEDPDNYQDAPREAIRRILQEVGDTHI